jgi:hypothetical protein
MTLLSFQQYVLSDSVWTPIMLSGSVARAWLDFTADLKLCSDVSDSASAIIMPISSGTRFMIPMVTPFRIVNSITLAYAKSVLGSQTVTLSWISQP